MKRNLVALGLSLTTLTGALAPVVPAYGDSGWDLPESMCINKVMRISAYEYKVTGPRESIKLVLVDSSDPASQLFASNDGTYRLEVWNGDRVSISELKANYQELELASLEVSNRGAVSEAITTPLASLPAPTALSPLSYRLSSPRGHVEVALFNGNLEQESCTVVGDRETIVLRGSDGSSFQMSGLLDGRSPSALQWNTFNYKTFIPVAVTPATPAGACGAASATFKGDNRSWSSSLGASHRTNAMVLMSWSSGTMTTASDVGKTVRLSPSFAEATASSAGIKFVNRTATQTYGRVEIQHAVGNPFCWAAGSIRYNVVVQIFKTGGVHVAGSGVQVPNHEMYGYATNGQIGTLGRFIGKSFICLSLNCGNFTVANSVP